MHHEQRPDGQSLFKNNPLAKHSILKLYGFALAMVAVTGLALLGLWLVGCDSSPSGPVDSPTARFSAQAVSADGTVTNATTPLPLNAGPPPVSTEFSNLSTFPRANVLIVSRWRVTPPGEEFERQDIPYTFRTVGEFLVTLDVEAEGQPDRATMTVFVAASSSTAAAVGEIIEKAKSGDLPSGWFLDDPYRRQEILEMRDGDAVMRAVYGGEIR